ncbi:MAG TPA: hypothetical protein PLS10_12555, partial [Chitinophagales bacterium]|nr:hypothetical protein [Chitinophagales bacterium]
ILSEGTMSRDELLLMKKYLYTSVDRIEDIERMLIIDHKDNKSFKPTETVIENKYVPVKEKEIVEVVENDHIEEVEAALSNEQKEELEDLVEEIHTEIEKEDMEFVGEIKSVNEEQKIEIAPLVESSIITEDYSLNKLAENKIEEVVEDNTSVPVLEKKSFVDSIITEDYSLNKLAENKEEKVVAEKNELVAETKSFADSIITEDYTLNKLFENKEDKSIVEKVPLVESIITEDYSINKVKETVLPVSEMITAEVKKEEVPLFDNVITPAETLAAKFEDQTTTSFADELVKKNKEETSFFEKFEQKLNETQQPQLFEMFDDGKEELHESFANVNTFTDQVNTITDKPFVSAVYDQHDTVLVAEKAVETMVEQLTPSSLNDVFKPQTVAEVVNTSTSKTLSESIALNDKFIFVRELFGNQFSEYETALKHLDTLNNFTSVEQYCNNTLWNKFNWTERGSAAARFMDVLKKKFS